MSVPSRRASKIGRCCVVVVDCRRLHETYETALRIALPGAGPGQRLIGVATKCRSIRLAGERRARAVLSKRGQPRCAISMQSLRWCQSQTSPASCGRTVNRAAIVVEGQNARHAVNHTLLNMTSEFDGPCNRQPAFHSFIGEVTVRPWSNCRNQLQRPCQSKLK